MSALDTFQLFSFHAFSSMRSGPFYGANDCEYGGLCLQSRSRVIGRAIADAAGAVESCDADGDSADASSSWAPVKSQRVFSSCSLFPPLLPIP